MSMGRCWIPWMPIMQMANLPNDMSRSWGMRRIILLSKNDLDALSAALRHMEPLTLTRTLADTELSVEVRPAHPVWHVAMVVQVRVKKGRVEWGQTFESVEQARRAIR